MQLHDLRDDGQSDSEPGCGSARGVGLLIELEDVRSEVAADAGAGIGNRQTRVAPQTLEANVDLAFARRKLDRVGQQVPHDLQQANVIAAQRRWIELEV